MRQLIVYSVSGIACVLVLVFLFLICIIILFYPFMRVCMSLVFAVSRFWGDNSREDRRASAHVHEGRLIGENCLIRTNIDIP